MYELKIHDPRELQALKGDWNDLVRSMKRPSVFCTWEWIYTWWEHFGHLYKPFILVVYKGTQPIGILPLAWRKMVIANCIFPIRVLSFCSSIELFPDHLDIIASQENAAICSGQVLEFLARRRTDWDVIYLSHLFEGSMFLEYLSRQRQPFDVENATVSPYIPLTGAFEDYLKTFSKKHRYNLTRQRKQLYSNTAVQLATFDGTRADELEQSLGAVFALHEARKKQTGIESTFTPEIIQNFHYALSERLAKAGWLRISMLREGEKPIAAVYGFNFAGCFSYYQTGFDPQWEKYSVGATLLLEVIQKAYEEGCVEFDFLCGEEKYKDSWCRDTRSLLGAKIYNDTLPALLVRRFFRARAAIKHWRNGSTAKQVTGNERDADAYMAG